MAAIELLKYFVIVIVVWRITHLLNEEDGPFDIIYKVRKFLGNGFAGKLMDCFYCLSIWIGLIFAIFFSEKFFELLIMCLYYSGTAILLEKFTNKNFQ
jgi:Protein of unknown function (DUF1360)